MVAWKVDKILRKISWQLGKLMEGVLIALKVDRIWKVSQSHGQFTELDLWCTTRSRGRTKIDGRSSFYIESWWMFTKGFPAVQKSDKSWQKVTRLHKKLTEFNRWSPFEQNVHGSWREVSQVHLKMAEDERRSPSLMERWRRVFCLHRMLKEVDKMSPGSTECSRKLTEGLQFARKVDGSSQKVSRLHKMLNEVYERTLGCTNWWRKIFWPQGKLTEGGGRSTNCAENQHILIEGLLMHRKLMN